MLLGFEFLEMLGLALADTILIVGFLSRRLSFFLKRKAAIIIIHIV